MDSFTHMFVAILVAMGLLGKVPPEFIISLWLFSFLPDLDVFLEPFQKIHKSYFLSHKAASHSIIIGIIFTGIFNLFFLLIIPDFSFFMAWMGGILGWAIHSSLDFFTASRIPIFYPFSKKEYRFIADRAINFVLAVFSSLSMLYLISIYFIGAGIEILLINWLFFTIFYFCYFSYKAILRIIVQFNLPNGYLFIPGILPFSYLIYEKNESNDQITYTLVKKSVFSSKRVDEIKKTYNLNSEEMEFYNKSLEYRKEFRFFYKWEALIPLFQKNDEYINVVLILAEGYAHGRCYSLSILYNRNTKELIKKRERFENIKEWSKELVV